VEATNEFDAVAEPFGSSAAASAGAKSMRTTKKPTWHKRGASAGGGSAGGNGALGVEQVGLRSRVVVRSGPPCLKLWQQDALGRVAFSLMHFMHCTGAEHACDSVIVHTVSFLVLSTSTGKCRWCS
jgi:hypothetical protein